MIKKNNKRVKISKKLFTIASLVTGDVICDVGCDHGHLAVYLACEKNKFVYACDVRKDPLKKAILNAQKHNVLNKIEFILCDGLNWDFKKLDTIVIAGMGGKLIQRILFEQDFVRNKNLTIILQPQSFLYELRENLYLKGFQIEKELPVFEKNKFYNILVVKFTGEALKISLKEKVLGKILTSESEDFLLFLEYNILKLKQRLKGLKAARKEEKGKIKLYEKMLKILKSSISDFKEI